MLLRTFPGEVLLLYIHIFSFTFVACGVCGFLKRKDLLKNPIRLGILNVGPARALSRVQRHFACNLVSLGATWRLSSRTCQGIRRSRHSIVFVYFI